MKKHIIWSNINLKIEDWKDGYQEWLEINEIDDLDPDDEDEIYEYMIDTNNHYLDDERCNLNKKVNGRILAIVDLGLWDGRHQGYKILNDQISDILDSNCDECEWYSDGYNIRFTGYHHDGCNHIEYRVIKEDKNIHNLLAAILAGEEITRKKLNYYTRSLHPYIAEVYGW